MELSTPRGNDPQKDVTALRSTTKSLGQASREPLSTVLRTWILAALSSGATKWTQPR